MIDTVLVECISVLAIGVILIVREFRKMERMRAFREFQRVVIPLIRRQIPSTLAQELAEVQPMSNLGTDSIFSLRALNTANWELPTDRRSVYPADDITMLLIMGYQLTHGHNCCTGFGGKWRAPMPYWLRPGEVSDKKPCEHDWEVNYSHDD